MFRRIAERAVRAGLPGLCLFLSLSPAAHSRGLTLDLSQKNVRASYGFSLGSRAATATEVDFGVFADTDRNAVYFARASVHGNISGTDEGWRFGGGGQFNYVYFSPEWRQRVRTKNPQPHSIDLFLAGSWTLRGKVPIQIGVEINFSPEILSFGALENKFGYYTYISFEILPSFIMRTGYQGYNYFFKNEAVARLNTRVFIGIDILF